MDNITLLLGNAFALIASIIMATSGVVKDGKKFLICQNAQLGLSTISNLILGGYTGALLNVVSIGRNILCYNNKFTKTFKIVIVIIQVVGCLLANNIGWIGLCPLISVLVYTLFLTTDAKKLKLLTASTVILWAIYDFYIQSYTAFAFDIFTMITNLVGLYRVQKKGEDNIV